MQIAQFQQPLRAELPKSAQPAVLKQNDPEPPPQEESFLRTALDAGLTIVQSAAESGLYYYGGGGTAAGCATFGAVYNGISMAFDGAQIGREKGGTRRAAALGAVGYGTLGAGAGALAGLGTFALANALGGGVPGALMAGAAFGVVQVAGQAIFDRSTN